MRALPPNDAIAAGTFFSSFSLRASKSSSPAPASAISLAIAAPTPLDAPVTRTVLPLISMRVLPGSFPLRPNSSCPLWVKLGHSATLAQRPICRQADTAGRFYEYALGSALVPDGRYPTKEVGRPFK